MNLSDPDKTLGRASRITQEKRISLVGNGLGKGVTVYLYHTMKNIKKKRQKFNTLIRIQMKQKRWLKENKGECRTMAGFLDKIINDYKNGNNEKAKT